MKKLLFGLLALGSFSAFAQGLIILEQGDSFRVSRENVGARVECRGEINPPENAVLIIEKQGEYYYIINEKNRLRIGPAGHSKENIPMMELAIRNIVGDFVCSHNGSWKIFNAWTGRLVDGIPFNGNVITYDVNRCIEALYEYTHR